MPADELLPDPLPADPMPMFATWFSDARARNVQPNPDAMVLATVGDDGAPSARVVLCKRLVADQGFIVFFTNYDSRKGRELAAHPRAAVVFHWDVLHRQVRLEGPVVRSPAPESDQYFASRAFESRVGAWASVQSEPLASRAAMVQQVQAVRERLGLLQATEGEVPRPPHWGGIRLWIDSIELWSEGAGRIHDRARWQRTLTKKDEFTFSGGQWTATRLNP
ncbi:pyridoxamine 5'-phosphate oxidase [Steroidobacter sp. S1-65]|uniref:Pyridoxine/pyridoxamine 5'-phosphate oxidase n=1 Tax=Steroidobacter gossypii TaxID=2805490 RepID=A0ABS1X431_9GAMM|nr:pyridoxamine 5'-phosphate oxidase [Steroidobacter gossypii]MBM0107962.1 pyridoxamine 5'-phosphate oxidase [Steroidobacter gossypii]